MDSKSAILIYNLCLVGLILLLITWFLVGRKIGKVVNHYRHLEEILLHECEKKIAQIFLKYFPIVRNDVKQVNHLKHISVIYTTVLAKVAYSINDGLKPNSKQNKKLEKAIDGFIHHHLKSRKIFAPNRIKEEKRIINSFYYSHSRLFLEFLSFLDYQNDLDLRAKTSYQDIRIDRRLRKITKENEEFFQLQCKIYSTFLQDCVSEYSAMEEVVKVLFVDDNYKKGQLTKEGRTEAFYFFEVCYEVFLDILRYRLMH